jgi:hypothetical protein
MEKSIRTSEGEEEEGNIRKRRYRNKRSISINWIRGEEKMQWQLQ